MPLNLGAILTYATRALAAIPAGVAAVQAAQTTFKSGGGPEKKAAVLALVKAELAAAEVIAGRDLANDPDVEAAAGQVIDAAAFFQKLVAHKAIGPAT